MTYIRQFFLVFITLLIPAHILAGAWTLPKGKLSVKTSLFFQSTNSRFCTAQDAQSAAFHDVGCTAAGHRAPFDPFIGGESEALVFYTTLTYGLAGWWDIGVQIPYYSLQFTNSSNPNRPRSNSFGDVQFISKFRVVSAPVVTSMEIAVKTPTGKFTSDAEVVNVSEGQWDYSLFADISKSLWPLPVYLSAGAGYRFRSDNSDFEHTMADEFLARAEGGYNITQGLLIKGTLDYLRGGHPQLKSTQTQLLWRRELLTVSPAVYFSAAKNFNLEAGVQLPLRGEDFPSGPQWVLAISHQFSLSGG